MHDNIYHLTSHYRETLNPSSHKRGEIGIFSSVSFKTNAQCKLCFARHEYHVVFMLFDYLYFTCGLFICIIHVRRITAVPWLDFQLVIVPYRVWKKDNGNRNLKKCLENEKQLL